MTEKEFENLKVGDKVWIITDWFNKSNEGMKAVELEVQGKEDDEQIIQFIGVCFNAVSCSLTKSEAWEKEIKRCEEALKFQEQEVEKGRKALDRYKAELAKAREEEEVVWTVDFDEGSVVRSTKRRWEGSVENHEWSLGSPRYKPCETEREAYEALAKFYERKLFKALEKCGYKFGIPCDKWIVPMLVRAEEEDVYRVIYYPSQSYGCARKQDLFDTLEEAEAELERRKNDERL